MNTELKNKLEKYLTNEELRNFLEKIEEIKQEEIKEWNKYLKMAERNRVSLLPDSLKTFDTWMIFENDYRCVLEETVWISDGTLVEQEYFNDRPHPV